MRVSYEEALTGRDARQRVPGPRPVLHRIEAVRLLEAITDEARRVFEVPDAIAAHASEVTLRRFARHAGRVSESRLEAYFWGVVRARALRGGPEVDELRARYIEASLA